MRRLLFLLLFPSFCFAQTGAHRIGQVLVKGNHIAANVGPYASVQVCVAAIGCKTLANIYGDATLTSPLSNPLTADGSGNYDYYIASGCVDERISTPGQGLIFTPNVCPFSGQSAAAGNPAPPAYAVQYANSAVNSFQGDGTFNFNPTTHALTSKINNGLMNSDSFSNVAGAQASSTCTTTNCPITTPPTSTDTTTFGALPEQTGLPSSFWMDYRGNQFGITGTNPLPTSITNGQYQALRNGSVAYTEPNPNYQGAEQLAHYEQNYFLNPGYSNGQSGCPMFCPSKGYIQDSNGNLEGATTWGTTGATIPTFNGTTGGTTADGSVVWTNYGPGTTTGRWAANTIIYASQWSDSYLQDVVSNFNTAGIKGWGQTTNNCYGVGDCQAGGYNYPKIEGGASSPSDEGAYAGPAFLASTSPDYQGTLTTITDANHIITTPTANNGSQGDGRFLIDISQYITGTDGQPLSGMVDSVTAPAGNPYGTVVMSSANMPISYAQGTLANNCVVSVQNGTVAQTTCTINVTSGTFDTASPVCMANTSGNTYAFGAQPISMTTSGGVATITTKINKSVPSGAYVFQGGMCGAMFVPAQDILAVTGGTVYGSAFMILGSTDAHTAVYANYIASQVWGPIPNAGSQFVTKATGGVTLTSLTRTSNVVTATVSSGGAGTPPLQDEINGSNYFVIAGCSDTTMNGTVAGPGSLSLVNGVLTDTYAQTGSNSTCASATYYPQSTTAYFYWGTEVYDVADHTPGLSPKSGVLDGHFLTSYQPHFVVGHKLDMPPHYSLSIEGIHANVDMSEPAWKNNGITIAQGGVSGLGGGGAALNITNTGVNGLGLRGVHGTAPGNVGVVESGYYTEGLNMTYAPMHKGCVLCVGYAPPFYDNNSVFSDYYVLLTELGRSDIEYNSTAQTYAWNFSSELNSLSPFTVSPTGVTQNQSTVMKTAQFEGSSANYQVATPVTQLSDCGRQTGLNAVCYDNITSAPIVTQAGTPGSRSYGYWIAITNASGTVTFTPDGITYTGNSPLNSSNYNVISCSVLPTGTTGTVYTLYGGGLTQVGATGGCTSPSASVNDTGSYGTVYGNTALSMGADMNVGRVVVNGIGGGIAWTQPTNFKVGTTSPLTISQEISNPAVGTFSFDTTAPGNGSGTIVAASVLLAHQPLRYVGTLTTTAAASDTLTVTGLTASNHCSAQQTGNATPLASTVSVGTGAVTLYHAATAGDTFDLSCNVP